MRCHDAHACREYNTLSRRGFLALTGKSALIAGAAAAAPAWMPRVAVAKDHRGAQRDVLVFLFMRGAADGLSICPPWSEEAYYTNRPNLAVPRPDSGDPGAALDLGDGLFGMHPRLGALMPAYRNGHLLFVHATGSTDPTRSHFDAQRFMEVGKPADPTINTGWIGRHILSSAPTDPTALLRAIGINIGLPKTLVGGPLTLPIPNLDGFGLSGSPVTTAIRQASLTRMYERTPDPLHSAALTTVATIELLNTIDFAGYRPAGNATYPTGNLGLALGSAAALIKAEVGVEAIAIDVPGWDTHANQGTVSGNLANLLANLGDALGAFYTDMFTGQSPRVTVVAMSEFGRRLAENGGIGTDHGHGSVMMLMGECIHGGRVLTQWPGLEPEQLFERMDLAVTTDYRDILAEVVQTRLGNTELPFIFPGYTPTFRGVTRC